jgi:hypothetical protein
MKSVITAIVLAASAVLLIANARAEHHEKTIKGEALCAKCELKEANICQTAIRVKEGDKTVIYHATDNKVASDFHKKICTEPAKVVATGAVKEVDGKKHITLAKIERDKN